MDINLLALDVLLDSKNNINERFISFLWKQSSFRKNTLKLVDGRKLEVISVGTENVHAGPDFNDVMIKIDDIVWAGRMEIHTISSDWYKHKHTDDPAYQNIILHVVWEFDKEIYDQVGNPIPTLVLSDKVDDNTLEMWKNLESPASIICSSQLKSVPQNVIDGVVQKKWKDRLKRKSEQVLEQVYACYNDWSEAAYRTLARAMGFGVNGEAMLLLAQNIPFSILKKYRYDTTLIEALLFGQAGMLDEKDDYSKELSGIYQEFSLQHTLPKPLGKHIWKFSKTYPQNFPSIRIAQLASILSNKPCFVEDFSNLDLKEIEKSLKSNISTYWQKHYKFGKETKSVYNLSRKSLDILLINAYFPLINANRDSQKKLATVIKTDIPAERNHIVRKWKELGIVAKDFIESQGLIELYQNHCTKKKCLSCEIWHNIWHNI